MEGLGKGGEQGKVKTESEESTFEGKQGHKVEEETDY